jgi:hypothetical protein
VFVVAFVISTALAAKPVADWDLPLSDAALLERAEAEFHAGVEARAHPEQARKSFRAAADLYEALDRRGNENPVLCGNLGKSALLAGDLPRAVRAYGHGLRLEPGNGLLREDLEYARDQVQYPANTRTRPSADAWPPWLPRPTDDLLLAAALGLYGVACLTGTGWLMVRRKALLNLSVVTIVLAVVPGLWWALRQSDAVEQKEHPLVVIAADATPLRTGNGLSYPRRNALPVVTRGMEARLRFERGDWVQVEFPGGEVGWLPRKSVLIDE